jgi:hypothetical protein
MRTTGGRRAAGCIPIAAGILYPRFGILLFPIIAAAAMAPSSVNIIGNALRRRVTRLQIGRRLALDLNDHPPRSKSIN